MEDPPLFFHRPVASSTSRVDTIGSVAAEPIRLFKANLGEQTGLALGEVNGHFWRFPPETPRTANRTPRYCMSMKEDLSQSRELSAEDAAFLAGYLTALGYTDEAQVSINTMIEALEALQGYMAENGACGTN